MAARGWPALAALAFIGLLAGVLVAALVHGSASEPAGPAATTFTVPAVLPKGPGTTTTPAGATTAAPASAADRALRADVRAAVEQGVRAAAPYGAVQIGVALGGGSAPATPIYDAGRHPAMRAWSMIKAVTAVTLLRRDHNEPDAELQRSLEAAFSRSENCAQRKMMLELSRLLRSDLRAKQELRRTLEDAGGDLDIRPTQAEDGHNCAPGIVKQDASLSAADRKPKVPLVGITKWHLKDALRFVTTLRSGAYGDGVTARVLGLMRQPKLPSRETAEGEVTAVPSWGAGQVFTRKCWKLAYKGGWGRESSGDPPFLAGQIGVVELRGDRWAAFAVMYDPKQEPSSSDPGAAKAPEAIQAALEPLRKVLATSPGCAR